MVRLPEDPELTEFLQVSDDFKDLAGAGAAAISVPKSYYEGALLLQVSEFIQSYSVLPPRLGQTILNRLGQDGLIKKKGNLYYSAHFGLVASG